MEKLLRLLIFFFPIVISYSCADDYIYSQWFAYLVSFTVLVSLFLQKSNYPAFIKLISFSVLYAFISTAQVFANQDNIFKGTDRAILAVLSLHASYQFFAILVSVGLFIFFTRRDFGVVRYALGLYCLSNSIYVLIGALFGFGRLKWGIGYSGFIDYASINGCMIAATIPFLGPLCSLRFKREDRGYFWALSFFQVLAVIAIFLSKSSVPIGALAICLMAYFFSSAREHKGQMLSCMVIALIVVIGLAMYFDEHLFDSGYRFESYKLFMGFWADKAPMLTGFGPGTFSVLAPNKQLEVNYMVKDGVANLWIYLHSEWLQIIFEYGLLGFSLAISLFIWTARILFKNEEHLMFAALMSFSASCLFNFNLRYAMGSFFIGYLVCYAALLEQEEKCLTPKQVGF